MALLIVLSASSRCLADDDDQPSLLSYAFDGFFLGAGMGLSAGYLSTGSEFESGEWKNLVRGAGIGAVAGLGVGIGMAFVDVDPPPRGILVLRDMGYGFGAGLLLGVVIGALVWLDSGRPQDMLYGLSLGSLIGSGLGLGFGIYEAAQAEDSAPKKAGLDIDLSLSFVPTPDGPRAAAVAHGRF